MKINNNSFELNEQLQVVIDSNDNDGLIFIPKNIQLDVDVENYFGKIVICKLVIHPSESEFQIGKLTIENNIPNISQDIEIILTWMNMQALKTKQKLIVKHTTNECIGMIKDIKYKIDINTLHRIEGVNCIEMNDIARISIRSSKLIFYDSYKKNRQTGSLIIIDNETNETIGAAMIIKWVWIYS